MTLDELGEQLKRAAEKAGWVVPPRPVKKYMVYSSSHTAHCCLCGRDVNGTQWNTHPIVCGQCQGVNA